MSTRPIADVFPRPFLDRFSTARWRRFSPLSGCAAHTDAPLRCRLCTSGAAGVQVGTFGLLVGISLLLQGMNQFILSGVGYDDLSSGEGNTLYQLLAALVGVGLGSRVTCEADLRTVLRALHVAMAVGVVGFGVLCAAVGSEGVFSGSIVLMLGVMSLLGATLMGLLPFVLQQAVCECPPSRC